MIQENDSEISREKEELPRSLRSRIEREGYPDGFYDPYLIPVIEHYLSRCKIVMKVKRRDCIYADGIGDNDGIEGLSFILGYNAVSREEMRLGVYRLLFKMKRIGRVERNGKFTTKWEILDIKGMKGYLDEELSKHKFEVIDCRSRCGGHASLITQCKESGRIYDEYRCLVFKNEKEWKAYKGGNNNVGEKMKCLELFLKKEIKMVQSILYKVQDRYDCIVKERDMLDDIKIKTYRPPPDGAG